MGAGGSGWRAAHEARRSQMPTAKTTTKFQYKRISGFSSKHFVSAMFLRTVLVTAMPEMAPVRVRVRVRVRVGVEVRVWVGVKG